MEITAEITGIKYQPLLCNKLETFDIEYLKEAFEKKSTFILRLKDNNCFALSRWVSAKRTRSYPYARVYNSLDFNGKRVTVIPILKDEGKDGDRDYLEWDTISLMSLLGVYTIIAFYKNAVRNFNYKNKITNQRFNIEYLKEKLSQLTYYQSDALHWNIEQLETVKDVGKAALDSYKEISENLNIEIHDLSAAKKRIEAISESKDNFMNLSRDLAKKAQNRESLTTQPKEFVEGSKAKLTIKNYLGGNYYFTADEVRIEDNNIYLIECKHSNKNKLPSIDDIKDGLLKMILFTNLKNVSVDSKKYNSISVLKLTSENGLNQKYLGQKSKELLNKLYKEASLNNFEIFLN